jgi:alpha-methylacyl-CoA racemase
VSGPLKGIRIVEIASLGPGPFAAMMLADHGAEVIRVERPGAPPAAGNALLRSRRIVNLDLKSKDDLGTLRSLVRTADGLIEGFRPGTMERLGLGPDELLRENPKLVYGRMTGWGQAGPYAPWAGHDINYVAVTGALHAIGPAAKPTPPLSLVGDFGGGGMMLAFAMTAALLHSNRTGQGQTLDCAMVDGAALLMTPFHSMLAAGTWEDRRESNILDGGAHFYGVYETADGKYVSVGSIELQFYARLLDLIGLRDDPAFSGQMDKSVWPRLREIVAKRFLTKTRDEWCALLEQTDACFAPVLSMAEAPQHSQAQARRGYVTVDGVVQPAPAPRYSVSSLDPPRSPEAWNTAAPGAPWRG